MRKDRAYRKAKERTQKANQIKIEETEKQRLKEEAEERDNGPRRDMLRAKALRDIRGWTGEYK